MQTLKTAAIVVLLMTVMYGAYVSLTTPPEPLPEDVQDMLVTSDQGTLAIDASLPDSLGELEINTGVPTTPTDPTVDSGEAAGVSLDLPANASLALTAPSAAGNGDHLGNPDGLDRLAGQDDLMTESTAMSGSGISTTLTDAVPQPADQQDVVASAESIDPSSPGRYPKTNTTFEMPDPKSVMATFESSQNQPGGSNLTLASSGSGQVPNATAVSTLDSSPRPSRNLGLANAIRAADKMYRDDKRGEALSTLSLFYNTPNLSGEQRSELLSRLDPLAREVIYSTRHLLEQPHRVGQNETLMEIAARYEVPWQLLANINQIEDPVTVLPGTELKVVRGPFRAEVNLSLKELTLFLGDMYAGRFPVGIGTDPAPRPGTFTVQDKQTSKTYYDAAGSPVPPGSPNNPYGEVWLDLGGQLCIHGSPSTTIPTTKGCISLAADYADDLYGILSQGSTVTIRR